MMVLVHEAQLQAKVIYSRIEAIHPFLFYYIAGSIVIQRFRQHDLPVFTQGKLFRNPVAHTKKNLLSEDEEL